MSIRRAFAVGFVAVCALMSLVGSATASTSIAVTPAGPYTARGTVTLTNSGVNVICTVTYSATHEPITKMTGSPGRSGVSAISATGCNGGAAIVWLNINQWRWTYNSFSGTLPRITQVLFLVRDVQFLITFLGLTCLYRGPVGLALVPPNNIVWLPSMVPLDATQPLNSRGCPAAWQTVGSFIPTVPFSLVLV
jgi:hypothetical protein